MKKKDPFESALRVQKGIEQPAQTNDEAIKRLKVERISMPTFDNLLQGILNGDRVLLSRAITLIESAKPEHQKMAQDLIAACLPYSGKSIRIGVTGVPGVGKSTFIESFGSFLTSLGKMVAVLAIDPSSQVSGGSILGDKTRMEKLSSDHRAFIRPSPSAGTLGGVARKTRESVVLCEAAGFDTVIIETVGVGQSETAARSMVDFFLLLQLPAAGDELQGIKRGIMEMADAIFINKAEGDLLQRAKIAAAEIKNALHLMPAHPAGWHVPVGLCAAISHVGIEEVWQTIESYKSISTQNGYFLQARKKQEINRFHQAIIEHLQDDFYNTPDIAQLNATLEEKVHAGVISPYAAAQQIVKEYYAKIV